MNRVCKCTIIVVTSNVLHHPTLRPSITDAQHKLVIMKNGDFKISKHFQSTNGNRADLSQIRSFFNLQTSLKPLHGDDRVFFLLMD